MGSLSGLLLFKGDEPAHVHVRAGDCEAKLHDVGVAVNAGYPAHELSAIVRYLKSHRDELLAAWHEHFGD